jgi:hypothetical protein
MVKPLNPTDRNQASTAHSFSLRLICVNQNQEDKLVELLLTEIRQHKSKHHALESANSCSPGINPFLRLSQ